MIYFYGGAFNPMTKTHLDIIKELLTNCENSSEDSLIIAITDHDYKKCEYDYKTRFEIVLENLEDIGFKYTLIAKYNIIKQNQRTWKFLNETLKINNNLTLVIGEDEWNDLKAGKWHYSDKILNTYKIKVIPRVNNISSTKVRELLKNNASKDELLNYITEKTYNIIKS